ncbi:sigma-70 family RNA polymerase sigma factor [Chondromyces crocatus]|uniref:RNA polymerase sigma factor n=1 Tax=Chondromyces crocatus TaxID=52 RepID=A0A0K1EN95_CHOCO|nr:sigma-70 family RNA polymerase sigma factor [Chondromyces crocatus]AKT42329.1 RNA polymerase sigma factor [Chondromyces crocatus]
MVSENHHLYVEGVNLLRIAARRLARRLGQRVPLDDLSSYGYSALPRIVSSYDSTRSSFATYARAKLNWAMLDGVKQERRWLFETARAGAIGASDRFAEAFDENEGAAFSLSGDAANQFSDLLAGHAAAMVLGMTVAREGIGLGLADGRGNPEEQTVAAEMAVTLRRAVQELPDRERALVERHYYDGERFDHIAQELGISKSRASRLHAQAIATLSRRLRESD